MSAAVTASAQRGIGWSRICRILGQNRSTYTARAARKQARGRNSAPARRGRPSKITDEALLALIREDLATTPFVGEGHRKVWARLRVKGTRVSKDRVLRLMGQNGLLAPQRTGSARGPSAHDGSITPEKPDIMWGADLTATVTEENGQVAVFAVVDHCTAEGLGIHAAVRATRHEALEPVRQAVHVRFGEFRQDVAKDRGLALRHDHGSQYLSRDFQGELGFLGIVSSPAFVRAPEGNGCIERFFRTLKEQLLWVRRFKSVAELNVALKEWLALYNERWLIARHGYLSPAAYREKVTAA